jgi:hypothetical protein
MQDETQQQECPETECDMDLSGFTTMQVIAKAVMLCDAITSFAAYVEANLPWLEELKKRFQVTAGSRGIQLEVERVLIYWSEFCETYLKKCAADVRKAMSRIHQKDASEKSEPKPDEEKPLYQKGFLAGQEAASATEKIRQAAAEVEAEPETQSHGTIPDEPDADIVEELGDYEQNVIPEFNRGDVIIVEGKKLQIVAGKHCRWKLEYVTEEVEA